MNDAGRPRGRNQEGDWLDQYAPVRPQPSKVPERRSKRRDLAAPGSAEADIPGATLAPLTASPPSSRANVRNPAAQVKPASPSMLPAVVEAAALAAGPAEATPSPRDVPPPRDVPVAGSPTNWAADSVLSKPDETVPPAASAVGSAVVGPPSVESPQPEPEQDPSLPSQPEPPPWPEPPRLDDDGVPVLTPMTTSAKPDPVRWGWAHAWNDQPPSTWQTEPVESAAWPPRPTIPHAPQLVGEPVSRPETYDSSTPAPRTDSSGVVQPAAAADGADPLVPTLAPQPPQTFGDPSSSPTTAPGAPPGFTEFSRLSPPPASLFDLDQPLPAAGAAPSLSTHSVTREPLGPIGFAKPALDAEVPKPAPLPPASADTQSPDELAPGSAGGSDPAQGQTVPGWAQSPDDLVAGFPAPPPVLGDIAKSREPTEFDVPLVTDTPADSGRVIAGSAIASPGDATQSMSQTANSAAGPNPPSAWPRDLASSSPVGLAGLPTPPGQDPAGAGLSAPDAYPNGLSPDAQTKKGTVGGLIRTWGPLLVAAAVFAVLFRMFVMQAYSIPSESMVPTLEIGDRVLVNKVSYRLHDVNRGDLVVFERPEVADGESRVLVKRVIGLPGETVSVDNGQIFVGAQLVEESYVAQVDSTFSLGDIPGCTGPAAAACTIPDDHVFVMGDNRLESADSRSFGPVPVDDIVGRAFVKIWPLTGIENL